MKTWLKRTPIRLYDIYSLVKLCLKSTYFQLDDYFFEQIEGAAIGSPFFPIVANIYQERFEKIALQSTHLQPKHWSQYVDDTYVVWPHGKATLLPFLDHLNGIYDSIQFTMEE